MNYIEKVRYLLKLKVKTFKEYYIDVVPGKVQWQDRELENILQNYSFVPESYIKFIKEFDSLGLLFVVFYGSKDEGVIPLSEEIEELSEYTDIFRQRFFPFGKDADGSVFALARDQSIVYFDIQDYNFENEPEKLTNSFEAFITDYVLGPKCEYNRTDDLLRELKWV